MSKTIAIFGFGPGLGMGVARRFGREGFRVAVIGRKPDKAERHVSDLKAEGIAAAAFPADVTDATQVAETVATISRTFGEIDVALHGAAGEMADRMPSTLALDVPDLSLPMALKLHSPMLVTRALAPGMIERGTGALLFSSGSSPNVVLPYLSNFGVALAAQRGYLLQLAEELRGTGVYVGVLNIGVLIGNSQAERIVDEHPELVPAGVSIPRMTNDELGDRYWEMYVRGDRTEVEVGFDE
ncbi:SDR family NAD(P)-dependent oxidoreductase [Nocardia aurantiaca]|uniref:SDR family NAD(P)-dependent oxidoreductase n=1 Tax=Nocardia aurantiaca TaxID=2675850 RepID=A0A6I3KSG6_9NOCA|nr:SDR family oxidoreductase [Nocardia aurantiaca]MTE12457.1 SDR family NAD(P)-dependent oxidoreductase [Nocardia aurantiaca]